ncbi:hypothetical protein CEXT_676431 [Caerostris extrusa]|uniref:Uncharacterized protein n=1 Tax=Caerostris extrusa TaxID=172846 RepID=A0AAV4X209_CAEEX|nr:hypothetical protein CEXT_676431 [Caerostris extrusa]
MGLKYPSCQLVSVIFEVLREDNRTDFPAALQFSLRSSSRLLLLKILDCEEPDLKTTFSPSQKLSSWKNQSEQMCGGEGRRKQLSEIIALKPQTETSYVRGQQWRVFFTFLLLLLLSFLIWFSARAGVQI